MGGQAAEQIIAGVVLSERLAVTMYGAIHRAQFEGQRNQRGLVVDPKMLAEASFRITLTDNKLVSTVTKLDHPNIVPTVTVEDGGPDVVVVTRGVGRYVTVQDLIASAKSQRGHSGKLPLPVAAAIGKSVVEALASAHKAKVVHGAVHPRSVLVDEDGTVRLADFIVGRALTTAVAQGADSSLWRGLAGFLAPELVVGEDPTPAADVFACGAMLFTMLSGEAPPGTLHVTPAVERLVQRALDTDVSRRYKNASDLLENLNEAFEDDRWEIASRGEVIKAAGLSRVGSESGLDDATEDLLASLGSSAVSVTPTRPSMDARASEINARHTKTPTSSNRLDALLADLDDSREHTQVDDVSFKKRDPISELIQMDPRKKEAIVQVKAPRARVPSLDDPDEDTPLPLPAPRDSHDDIRSGRPPSRDEAAAMDALAGLDEPVRRMSSAAEQATVAAEKLESAARRAEAAAKRVDSESDAAPAKSAPRPAPIAKPLPEMPEFEDLPAPRLKSRALGIISMLVVIAGAVGFYKVYQDQKEKTEENKKKQDQAKLDAEAESKRRQNALKDKGTITYKVEPSEARPGSVWLKLGRSGPDFNTIPLTSSQMHRIRIELDGYQPIDTEVLAANWSTAAPDPKAGSGSGSGSAAASLVQKKATVNITLKAVGKDKAGKSLAEPLPARPPNLAGEPTGFTPGEGPINIQTSPPGAEVWLLIGYGDTGMPFPTIAGRAYELRALMDGYNPGYASITDEEWRDGGNPNVPLDEAPKKATIEKTITLTVDPTWVDPKDKKPKKGK